jgi:PleD family two-component response regulator
MQNRWRNRGALSLLAGVAAITSALTGAELIHRDSAITDPLTGLFNRTALESRIVELEHQAALTGAWVSRPGGLDVTVSVGVSAAEGADVEYQSLFHDADVALYEAKRSGRNRVAVAGRLADAEAIDPAVAPVRPRPEDLAAV